MLTQRVPDCASWTERARCRGLDTNQPPIELCADCSVRPQCLSHALADDIRDGRWGGYLPDERDALLAQHDGHIGNTVRAASIARLDPDGAYAAARARHPSASPETRAQLALDLYGQEPSCGG